MRWKAVYIYYILIALSLACFIFLKDMIRVPLWGTLFGVLLLLYMASDQSWKAFKRQGRAGILVSLKPGEGGHSTIHPDDISLAMPKAPKDKGSPSFIVFATGGFVHGGIEWQGGENFVVCPPEHVESTGSAFICHTKLRRVYLEELPDYVREELRKLKNFNPVFVKAQKNLWFGMTSKFDGTSTSANLAAETRFIDQTYIINQYKELIKDKMQIEEPKYRKGLGGRGESIVVNVPER